MVKSEVLVERPHNIAIGFSVAATLLSIMSLWVSNQSAKLVKISSRSDVQITQLRLLVPAEFVEMMKDVKKLDVLEVQKYLNAHPPAIEGTVINFGKTRGTYIKISELRFRRWGVTNGVLTEEAIDNRVISVPDLAPSRSQPAYFPTSSMVYPYENIKISGMLEYTDEGTGIRYQQPWCYQSKVNLPFDDLVFCSEMLPNPPPVQAP